MAKTGADIGTAASKKHAWQTFAILLIGAFMALLDVTIVNVALPSIQTGLHASSSALEWIVSGYALSLGLLLIPAGKVGDNIGHRWTFLTGMSLFTLASLACGLSGNQGELIAARVIQGFGAGIFTPAITAFIQLLFTGRDRSKAFSIFGAIIGLSSALGPLIGGLLVQAGGAAHGWRLVFMVNVPIGLVLVPLAFAMLPHATQARRAHNIDPLGIVLLTSALVLLLLPTIEGQRLGWPLWTWLSFVVAALLFVALWFWENSLERRGREAMIATELLRQPAFAAGSFLALVYFAAFTSIFFVLSILWQIGFGRSAMATGFALVPFALGSMISASQSHKVSERLGRWVLVLGCALVAAGIGLTLLTLHLGSSTLSAWAIAGPLLLGGLGNGLFIAPNQDFILAAVPRPKAGAASGMLSTAQRVGGSLGIAAVGSVFFGSIHPRHEANALAHAFSRGSQVALTVNVGLILLALLIVFALPKKTGHAPTPLTADA